MVESNPENSIARAPAYYSTAKLQPMPFWQALLYFGLPALLFRLSIYNGIPLLMVIGLHRFEASFVAFTVPSALLLAFAFGLLKRDGYPLTWSAIRERFRLFRLTPSGWLWTIAALVVTFLSIGALAFSAQWLVKVIPGIAPPDYFPIWLKPGASFSLALFVDYIGAPLKGNWAVAVLFCVMLFFNIFGEELWWRGYILPRQELTHGRLAWIIHGGLWLLWHVTFYPWQALALLPICLVIPFIAQRLHNTWPAVIIHLQNAAVLALVLVLVVGAVPS